jgi:molecular chaperone GrpE
MNDIKDKDFDTSNQINGEEKSVTENNNLSNIAIEDEIKEEIQKEIALEMGSDVTVEESIKKKIEELESQVNQFKDQLLRKVAEFENFKRRSENEFVNFTKYANEYLIAELLPIIDDFERSLNAGKEKPDFDSFYKGVELIYSKFLKTLEGKGVKVIDALNKPFDVNFHEAVMVMQKDGVPPSTVIQEIAKGYLLKDKVIRHTKVIVSGEPDTHKNQNTNGE